MVPRGGPCEPEKMSGCAGGRLLCTACARSSPRLHLHLAAQQGARYTRHRPAEDLAELTFLGLTRNELSGPIPPELGDLANLEELRLDENRLEGELPPELDNLIKLEQLHLDDNQLSGEIPAELIDLPDLALLYLSGNELSGCIPAALLDIADNDLDKLGLEACR